MRIALIGYGRIAPKHLEVLRALGADVVACSNRSEGGRERARSEGRIPQAYASIEEMMERECPDGVLCCVSVPEIFPTAARIIPYHVPTLIEKPPGTSWDEYNELRELARRSGTAVMVGLNRRYYSVLRRAIEDADGMENISQVSVDWTEDPAAFLKRGFSQGETARMIFGNSLHGLDLLAYLAGPLDQPQVAARNLGESFRWIMSLQGCSQRQVVASFHSTWDSPGRWRLQFCTPGRRYVFAPLETCVVLERGVTRERILEPHAQDRQFKPGFYDQAAAFLRMIATGKPPAEADLSAAGPAMWLAELLTNALIPCGL